LYSKKGEPLHPPAKARGVRGACWMKRNSNRSASIQKEPRKIYCLIPGGLILIAGIVLLSLYLNGFFYNRRDVQVKTDSPGEDITSLSRSAEIVTADMLSHTLSLLSKQMNTSPYAVSWYALPGSISSITSLASEYITSEDQVNLLRYYVKKGNKDAAKDLAKAITDDFTGEGGYLVPAKKVSELASAGTAQPVFPANPAYEELPALSASSMESTVEYLRALLEYYQKWGQASDWVRIEKLAAILYSEEGTFFEDLTILAAEPSPVPTGPGQDIVSTVEGQVSTGGSFSTLTLASLDLEVFRMLSSADSKYQPLYDKALTILSGAMISDDLPLFAIGYTQGSAGYVYYNGDTIQDDLVSSLKVTLHLAEEGKAPKKTILWIKEQLYNQGLLYRSYDLISGQATTDVESVEAYGIILQIARAVDDPDLYSKSLARLEWHLATNSTSAARSTIFRQLDNSRVVVYAKDNLEALLGV